MTIQVRNALGEIEEIETPLAPDRKPAVGSRPVVLSDEDLAKLEEIRQACAALLQHAQTVGTISVAPARYVGAALIVPGTPVASGQGVFIACTEPGVVRLLLENDSILDVPVVAGASMLNDIAVKDVVTAETTAIVAVSVMVKE